MAAKSVNPVEIALANIDAQIAALQMAKQIILDASDQLELDARHEANAPKKRRGSKPKGLPKDAPLDSLGNIRD